MYAIFAYMDSQGIYIIWLWVKKNGYPKWNPGKWNPWRKQAVQFLVVYPEIYVLVMCTYYTHMCSVSAGNRSQIIPCPSASKATSVEAPPNANVNSDAQWLPRWRKGHPVLVSWASRSYRGSLPLKNGEKKRHWATWYPMSGIPSTNWRRIGCVPRLPGRWEIHHARRAGTCRTLIWIDLEVNFSQNNLWTLFRWGFLCPPNHFFFGGGPMTTPWQSCRCALTLLPAIVDTGRLQKARGASLSRPGALLEVGPTRLLVPNIKPPKGSPLF